MFNLRGMQETFPGNIPDLLKRAAMNQLLENKLRELTPWIDHYL